MLNFRYAEFPDIYEGEINISIYHELSLQYCKINSKTIKHIKEVKDMLLNDKKNILGVSYRGTDMKIAKDHHTPPSIEQILHKTLQIFNDEKFDYIFLKTEEQEAVDEFCKVFSRDILLFSEVERIKNYGNQYPVATLILEKTSNYKSGLDYLTDVFLLSQCDGIIASKNNSTVFALGLNNNKYRYSYIFDLGINL